MLYKVIGGLVAVLVLAVGIWVGAYLWQAAQEGKGTSAQIGPAVQVGGGDAGGGTAARARQDTAQPPSANVPPDELVVPGELLVADPPRGFAGVAEQMGFSVIEVVRLRQLDMEVYRLAIPRGSTVVEARRQLASRFPGVAIDSHRVFETQGLDEYQNQTARPTAGWSAASLACGAGLRIGQIDSPVDLTHPALKGQRIEFRSFNREDRRPGPADHGTAVAAMLVGKPDWGGLLPGAELFAANMFEINETGSVIGSGMGLLKAVDWMIEKQVQVLNMSVAGGDNQVVRKAIDKAREKGLVVVAAAGNWGSETKPAYPAAYRDVIAVTALDRERQPYDKANHGPYIDFAAPGVRIYTAVPNGGRIMSGTSFAVPYVSVLLAMFIEAGAPKSPDTLRELLSRQVIDLGDPGKDDVFGWGIIKLQPKCGQ